MGSQRKDDMTMTISEILKAKGISDDLIQAVLDDMKTNSIYTASEENLDIRHGKTKEKLEAVTKERDEANNLIAELKKTNKGNEDLQQKVTAYETQIATLQAQLEETQIDADVHVELLAAGVKPDDIDYVMYKLKAKGKLERGDDGKIKDMDDKIAALKMQLPGQFTGEKRKNILENKLPESDPGDKAVTREEFNKMGYNAKVELRQQNPELYSQLAKTN
jgi:hypothetical protein